MAVVQSTIVALLLTGIAQSIYPDDHWTYSKELTVDNFKQTVLDEIEADRTLFAPAWNQVVKDFAGNPDVAFGDVNLAEQAIRDYSPGAGGWPTVRYFNKETGPDGAPYAKKTDKKMCDELGDIEYMTMYVEEAGNTSKCALDGKGCSERELKYIEKMKEKGGEAQQKQLDRLQNMKDKDLAPDLKEWKNKRVKILQQLVKPKEEL